MITIKTFGYLHRPAPEAEQTWDLRRWLRDPAGLSADLLDSDGRDFRVQGVVWKTEGAQDILSSAVQFARACQRIGKDATVAFGCAGGKHRAASMGIFLALALKILGIPHTLEHLDIEKDRVL